MYIKWKRYDNSYNSWINKKRPIKKVNTFLSPLEVLMLMLNINVKVDLSNYATKTDLRTVTHVHNSSFALKI